LREQKEEVSLESSVKNHQQAKEAWTEHMKREHQFWIESLDSEQGTRI